MEMVRLFLAVPVPKKIKEELAKEAAKIKASLTDWEVNWVVPENSHITLIFFGWAKQEDLEGLKKEIPQVAEKFPAFKISTGLVSFGDHPIWFDLEKGEENIHKLQQELGKKLTLKGSYLEKRPFHAHLTIGKIKKKGRSKLPKVEKSFKWKADKVVLYQSKLRRSGSLYTELASFPLGETDNF